MSLSSRVSHPCSRCAQPVDVVIYKSFVIDSDEALQTITSNRFHLVHCTRCGELRTFEADFLVTDQKRSMFVQVIERDDQVANMIDSMRSMLGDGVYARIVPARYALVEKVRLWSQGLDDAAIEVLKYILRLQLKDLEGKTKRYFERREGEDLVFSVVTPGQPLLATKLSMDLYRKMLGQLATSGIERGLEVDERLARRFLDGPPAAKAAPAPPAPPAAKAAPAPPAPPVPAAPPAPPAIISTHRYLDLPFAAEHFGPSNKATASLTCNAASIAVDVVSGMMKRQAGRFERQTLRAPFSTCGDLEVEAEETALGPRTIVRSPEGARVELEGAPIDLVRTGNLCAAVLAHPARGHECVAFLLGSPLVQVRLPAAPRAPFTASDGVVACAGDGCVHVFREVDGRVSSVTVPIPPAQRTDIALVAGRLCVIAVKHLVIIELTALPWGAAQRAVALDLAGVRWPGERLAEPARVVAAMPNSVVVNHPKLGRLTLSVLPGSPALARGGEVMIDDVREELLGIHKVYAWRAGSAAPCVTPLPGKIALAAPALPAIEPGPPATPTEAPVRAASSRGAAARVTALASRHGFVVSPLLLRVLEARERDPVLARWLDLIGLELGGPESMIEDWDADPSLLELSQRGNGDAHCLYIYPPWCREGREPPVVTFCHETNFLDFEALSFADFLERRLADTHADARVVALVRERLSLPPREVAPATPPGWLPLDESWSRAKPAAREQRLAMERSGDVLGAERAALHAYLLEGEERAAAREELRRMYAALGWGFALENLVRSGGEI